MKLSAVDKRCESCDGRGYWRDEFNKKRTCTKCNGTGKVKEAATAAMKCLRCDGSGKERKKPNRPAAPCYWCEGTGVEPVDEADVSPTREGVGMVMKFGDPLPEPVQGASTALSQHDKRAEGEGEQLRIVKVFEEPEREFGTMEFSDGAHAVWNSATGDAWYTEDTRDMSEAILIIAGGRASGLDELQKYVEAIERGFDGSAQPLPEDEIESVKELAWS